MSDVHLRVLLVEDSLADAELTALALRQALSASFELDYVSSVSDAIVHLRQSHIDVILLDLDLGETHGIETVTSLRPHAANVPIVVLSGGNDEHVALEALECGAQDYLLKGAISSDVLSRTIRYAIQRQQAQEAIRRLLERVQKNERTLRQKNKRLADLYETASRFVDNVSHEFRTPLTVIREYASLMRDGVGGEVSPQYCRFLDIITDRTDDLATMVDDMLDVSRLEAGLLGFCRKPYRLVEIVDRIRPSLLRKGEVKRVDLQIDIDDNLPEVFCDAEKVGRVIINLAVNAIKFTGESGCVRVWAVPCPERREVHVGVTDNGPGIEPSQLSTIFERFKQVDRPTRGTAKGFGLGLSIAKELVDLSFGAIEAESEPGRGSTFRFSLPMVAPEEILRRYLNYLKRLEDAPRDVSLVAIAPESNSPDEDRREVEALLDYLLRRNDLMYPLDDGRLLLVLAADGDGLSAFLCRARQTLKEANRNRPYGPLPQFTFQLIGTLPATIGAKALLEHAEAAAHFALTAQA